MFRLINFFKLLNKRTNGEFMIISSILLTVLFSFTMVYFGYGITPENTNKPHGAYLILGTLIDTIIYGISILFLKFGYSGAVSFMNDKVIPTWKDSTSVKKSKTSSSKIVF